MASNEKALVSVSELGVAALFNHTLLYRCDNPRTTINFSSITVIPGMRFTTSAASLSCNLEINWLDIPFARPILL